MAAVLLVDDDPLLRETMSVAIARANHQVLTAPNGRVAVEILQSTPIDIMVVDILMPEQDGIGTILEVRRGHAGLCVIAISGGSPSMEMDVLGIAAKLGADFTLTKPFTPKQLLELVARCGSGDSSARPSGA